MLKLEIVFENVINVRDLQRLSDALSELGGTGQFVADKPAEWVNLSHTWPMSPIDFSKFHGRSLTQT